MKFELDEGIPNRDAVGPRETLNSALMRNKRSFKTRIGYADDLEGQAPGAVRVIAVRGRKLNGEPLTGRLKFTASQIAEAFEVFSTHSQWQ